MAQYVEPHALPSPSERSSRLAAVSLYSRDHYSRGKNRKIFGYEAYHWGIIIAPHVSTGRDCLAFEATDRTEWDPKTFRMINPTIDWWMRGRPVNPSLSGKLLGRIVVGEIPVEVSDEELGVFFHQIPLPVKNTHPQQSCVTWTLNAVRQMQALGWAWEFDVDQFKDTALLYADGRNKELDGNVTEPEVKYLEGHEPPEDMTDADQVNVTAQCQSQGKLE